MNAECLQRMRAGLVRDEALLRKKSQQRADKESSVERRVAAAEPFR